MKQGLHRHHRHPHKAAIAAPGAVTDRLRAESRKITGPRRAIIATNRWDCSFAHSLGKPHARRSHENWRCNDSIGLR